MVLVVSDGIFDFLVTREQYIVCEVMYLGSQTSWLFWHSNSLLYVGVGDVCLVTTLRSNVILDKVVVLL